MIKEHQIKALTEASNFEGLISGFVINFRKKDNVVYFLNINDFNKFVASTTKCSINEKDIISSGGIVIECKKKIVKYNYFIKEFIETLKGMLVND